MKTTEKFTISALAVVIMAGTAGCADMSERDKSTAIGAGVGAVGGSVLSGVVLSEPLAVQQSVVSSVIRSAKTRSNAITIAEGCAGSVGASICAAACCKLQQT